jgi:hypothetical protein
MPHLLVDISAHGYGHLGQTAPVLNALPRAIPGLEVTVRSDLSAERLARRIDIPFRHVRAATDFGYVMRSAIDLDLPATARRYREFHRDWDAHVAGEAAWLRDRSVDAVLANAAYLPLAGAARAGIPAIALSSLNWADLFQDNFGGEAWATAIHREMGEAYGAARVFLRVTPGLATDGFRNLRVVGPVCRLRRADRAAMARRLGIDPAERWLLFAMGGIGFPIDLSRWPRLDGVRFLVPSDFAVARPDVTAFDSLAVDFTDLLAAADAVLTKPGYGTFVEAACHGRPVLYVPRDHWAEAAALTDWLHRNARALPVERERLMRGDLEQSLAALFAQPVPPAPEPTGIAQAAEILAEIIAGG